MKNEKIIVVFSLILGIIIGSFIAPYFLAKEESNETVTITTPEVKTAGPGEHCGGNMTNASTCGAGYHCAPIPGSHLPFGDVGGICVKN